MLISEFVAYSTFIPVWHRPGRIFLSQFASTMVAVLLAAAVVSALLGDLADTVAIVAIVLLNTLLGFVQEYRAEKAMTAVYAPPLQGIFRTVPLLPGTLALCAAAGAALFLALEGRKFVIALARGRSLD